MPLDDQFSIVTVDTLIEYLQDLQLEGKGDLPILGRDCSGDRVGLMFIDIVELDDGIYFDPAP